MAKKDKIDNSKEKVFISSKVNILGNVITCENSFLQISNITQVWEGTIPKPAIPIIPLIISTLISIICFYFSKDVELIILILPGVAILVIVLFVFSKYINAPQYYGLNIELTSSNIYSFTSDNKEFINRAYNVLKLIIQTQNTNSNLILNFGDGIILNGVDSKKIEIKK